MNGRAQIDIAHSSLSSLDTLLFATVTRISTVKVLSWLKSAVLQCLKVNLCIRHRFKVNNWPKKETGGTLSPVERGKSEVKL